MPESSNETSKKSWLGGWIKTAIAGVLSAFGGAVLMYASPVVESVIKPAKPVPNFQAQANGLTVVFQNKSTGAQEGWWDFGDGTALEPFVADEATISHTFPKNGSYSVKLSLKNLLQESNERVVPVTVAIGDGSAPAIETFEVVPVRGDFAPAAFRVVTQVKNADQCVWALSDRVVELSPETARGNQERFVTFNSPGEHVIKLAAFNGNKATEKVTKVVVKPAPVGMVRAVVSVAYEAVKVEQIITTPVTPLIFPAGKKENTAIVSAPLAAELGYFIVDAQIVPPPQPPKSPSNVKSPKIQIDPAKRDKAVLTCELTKPTAKTAASDVVQVKLTQQKQSPPTVKTLEPMSVPLTVPGSTVVPLPTLPQDWVAQKRKLIFALEQDGKRWPWQENVLPNNVPVPLPSGQTFVITAIEQNGQLRIDVTESKGGWTIFGN